MSNYFNAFLLSLISFGFYLPLASQEVPPPMPSSFISSSQKAEFKENLASSEENFAKEHAFDSIDGIQAKGCMHFILPFEPSLQLMSSIDSQKREVELKDGSIWKVGFFDKDKLSQWNVEQKIVIQPAPWYSLYDYILYNVELQTSASATLQKASYLDNVHCCWIMEIDLEDGFVLVGHSNGWVVCPGDEKVLAEWQINERIVIGENTYSASKKGFPYILINTNRNTFVRAFFSPC